MTVLLLLSSMCETSDHVQETGDADQSSHALTFLIRH